MQYVLIVVVFLLGGCMTKPLHYANSVEMDVRLPKNWSIEWELDERDKRSLIDVIDSPVMTEWLSTVLNHSHELQVSNLELDQRELLLKQAISHQKPELNLNAAANRQKIIEYAKKYESRYQLGAQVSWELDLWGKMKKQGEGAWLDFRISRLQQDALKRSLIAQALKSRLNLSTMREQQGLATKSTVLLENAVNRAEQQVHVGRIALVDLEEARVNYRQSSSQLSLAKAELADVETSARRLAGFFGQDLEFSQDWIKLGLPNVEVPGRYLLNRPDVLMALVSVTRADTNSDIAYRSLFPSFSLSLDVTQTSTGHQNLLGKDPVWNLLGQLIQPVFNGGRMEAAVKIAELDAQKALVEYRRTLEGAYFEVESLSKKEGYLEKQIQAMKKAYSAKRRRNDSIEAQYRDGLAEYEQWLAEKLSLYEIERQLLTLETEQTSNRIDLFLALGLPVS
ncbi:hypothetical protein A9Q81_05160 [Gammaproteobacteria bacterium 42_54_T18]|nr:hypothetical protein A9Q81_05160 [Gammaproteobacteria bacterium 42_54_T18]